MVEVLLIVDLLNFVYNLTWLGFLTKKHYGQVTTTAGHIFELNVLFNYTFTILFLIFAVDLEALPKGTILEIIDSTIFYSYVASLAGSQIQTAVFLKTFNVNTIDTKTTGWIILAMEVFCLCMGVITNLYMPPWKADRSKTEICEFSTPEAFHRFTIPIAVVQVIVLVVIGLTFFRSRQVRRRSDNEGEIL